LPPQAIERKQRLGEAYIHNGAAPLFLKKTVVTKILEVIQVCINRHFPSGESYRLHQSQLKEIVRLFTTKIHDRSIWLKDRINSFIISREVACQPELRIVFRFIITVLPAVECVLALLIISAREYLC
jgi:hypothetical protein